MKAQYYFVQYRRVRVIMNILRACSLELFTIVENFY